MNIVIPKLEQEQDINDAYNALCKAMELIKPYRDENEELGLIYDELYYYRENLLYKITVLDMIKYKYRKN